MAELQKLDKRIRVGVGIILKRDAECCRTPSAATAEEAARSSEVEVVAKLEHRIKSRTGGCAAALGSAMSSEWAKQQIGHHSASVLVNLYL